MITAIQQTPISFKGTPSEDNTDKNKSFNITDFSGKVDEYTREADETVDSVKNATDTITKGLGQIGTSILGVWAVIKKPVTKAIEFFSKTVDNGTGDLVRKADWKKIGVAGAIIATVLTAIGVGVKIHNNNKAKAQEAAKAEEAAKTKETVKAEETEATVGTEA